MMWARACCWLLPAGRGSSRDRKSISYVFRRRFELSALLVITDRSHAPGPATHSSRRALSFHPSASLCFIGKSRALSRLAGVVRGGGPWVQGRTDLLHFWRALLLKCSARKRAAGVLTRAM